MSGRGANLTSPTFGNIDPTLNTEEEANSFQGGLLLNVWSDDCGRDSGRRFDDFEQERTHLQGRIQGLQQDIRSERLSDASLRAEIDRKAQEGIELRGRLSRELEETKSGHLNHLDTEMEASKTNLLEKHADEVADLKEEIDSFRKQLFVAKGVIRVGEETRSKEKEVYMQELTDRDEKSARREKEYDNQLRLCEAEVEALKGSLAEVNKIKAGAVESDWIGLERMLTVSSDDGYKRIIQSFANEKERMVAAWRVDEAKLKKRIEGLEYEVRETKKIHCQELKETFDGRLDKMVRKVEKRNDRIKMLEDDLDANSTRCREIEKAWMQKLNATMEEVRRLLDTAKAKEIECEQLKGEVIALKREVIKADEMRLHLEKELEQLRMERDRKEEDIDRLNNTMQEIVSQLKEEMANLTKQHADEVLQERQTCMEEAEKQKNTTIATLIQHHSTEMQKLREDSEGKLDDVEEELDKVKKELSEREDEISLLRAQIHGKQHGTLCKMKRRLSLGSRRSSTESLPLNFEKSLHDGLVRSSSQTKLRNEN